MRPLNSTAVAVLVIWLVGTAPLWAQNQYIGYVYPAGGQQGSTFSIRIGGQALQYPTGLVVSGQGVSVRLLDYYRVMGNQELSPLLSEQLKELRKPETTLSEAMVAKWAYYEFPAPIGPPELIAQQKAAAANAAVLSPQELAKQNLIRRIESIFAEHEPFPAVRSQCELIFAEVTIAPDAQPGRREIRVVTKRGISNPLPFYVGQVPEVARKPMKTCQLPVLGREHLAQRHRPPEEEEVRISIPCTMNGQVGPGEINRYRFQAKKGQRLVISVLARELIPYVPDGVPGWFQAVIRLYDANGREVAFCDDFRFHPDPVLYFEVPEDGEYVLTIYDALFRGRESFIYRITIGELPYITSIFPLGGRVGQAVKIEADGWNLAGATISPPPADAGPGVHLVAAKVGNLLSNYVPFALDTLPESMETEPNDQPAQAQKVQLPLIINGRIDRPGDWDLFELEGKAGQTIVAEVYARRLASPVDSFLKVTGPDAKILALNDDHFDAGSGLNTHHADSYLMVKLPADGKYLIHLGETTKHGGKEYAYRLRISPPQPDFALRVIPSRLNIRSNSSAALTVFAIRKDGFDGPIQVRFKDLPPGFESGGATLGPKQEVVNLGIKTTLAEMDQPVNLTVVGVAKVGDQEIVRQAVPAEDRMQAFLWRHLLPADTLPALVFNPNYQPPAVRVRPPIRDEDRPKDLPRTATRASVEWYIRQIENLFQEWLLTEEFANRQIADIEARLIK